MANSYKYLAAGRDKPYYVNNHSDSTKQFSETDIFKMLEFLIDNTFAMFGGHVFQQTVIILMDINCAPLRGCIKAVSRRFVSYELLPFLIVYVMMLYPWKHTLRR
jgi:hypothetical protein